jgi:hypothetical protein
MRGFREVGWVIAVAGTTLGCYMINLQVASERAALEEVSNRIVMAQRDIRVLQTEIGTRGRLEQLESWNVKVLALSAPQAHQFLDGGFQLASLTAPDRTIDPAAPVVLAAAPAPEPARDQGSVGPAATAPARQLMHVASLKVDPDGKRDEKAVEKPAPEAPKAVKDEAKAARPEPASKKQIAAAPKPAAREAPAAPQPARPASGETRKKTKDVQTR